MTEPSPFVCHQRHRQNGGPLCGKRGPADSIKRAWGAVTCPACLALRAARPDAPPPPGEGQAAPQAEVIQPERKPKDPKDLPPILIEICTIPPIVLAKKMGRIPPEPAVHQWAEAFAVYLELKLGELPNTPEAHLLMATLALGFAIMKSPHEVKPTRKAETPAETPADSAPEPAPPPSAET